MGLDSFVFSSWQVKVNILNFVICIVFTLGYSYLPY